MSPQPSRISFVGFGKETTPGTAVVATIFLPVHPGTFAPHDIYNAVPDTGVRGAYVDEYDQIVTEAEGEYGFEGDLFVDSAPVLFKSLLGEEALSGSNPYTHALTVLNSAQPPTYSVSDYNGFNTRRFPFGMVDSINIKFDAKGLLTYTAHVKSFKSATTSKPTQVFGAIPAKPGYTGTVTIAGSGTSLLQEADITLSRTVESIPAVNGTQDPYKMFAGGVSCNGKLTLIYEDDTFYTPYTTAADQAIDVSFGSGSSIFTLHATKGKFTDAQLDRGDEYAKINVNVNCAANTTDVGASGGYGPVKATFVNAVSTAY